MRELLKGGLSLMTRILFNDFSMPLDITPFNKIQSPGNSNYFGYDLEFWIQCSLWFDFELTDLIIQIDSNFCYKYYYIIFIFYRSAGHSLQTHTHNIIQAEPSTDGGEARYK